MRKPRSTESSRSPDGRCFAASAASRSALPFLPSLLPGTAYGADPVPARQPRFYWLTSDHGGVFEASMFPEHVAADEQPGAVHRPHRHVGAADRDDVRGATRSSRRCCARPRSALSAALVGKMNVLRGLDVPFYIAHNTGLHLGNYARNDGNGGDGKAVQASPRPTIDQMMAWSPSFYPDLSRHPRARDDHGSGRPLSWNYRDPAITPAAIQNVSRLLQLARAVQPDLRPRDAAGQRACADRRPRARELQAPAQRQHAAVGRRQAAPRRSHRSPRRAAAQADTTSAASCSNVTEPTDNANKHNGNSPDDAAKQLQLYNEVAARVHVRHQPHRGRRYGDTSRFVSYGGDWHQDVAHQWQLPDAQTQLVSSYQQLLLLGAGRHGQAAGQRRRGAGRLHLPRQLALRLEQECGMETHGSVSIPVVTFGSAAGAMKTGCCATTAASVIGLDLRSRGRGASRRWAVLQQWLATVLQAMRVPPSEFERWGEGLRRIPSSRRRAGRSLFGKHYGDTSSRYFSDASKWLPFLKA